MSWGGRRGRRNRGRRLWGLRLGGGWEEIRVGRRRRCRQKGLGESWRQRLDIRDRRDDGDGPGKGTRRGDHHGTRPTSQMLFQFLSFLLLVQIFAVVHQETAKKVVCFKVTWSEEKVYSKLSRHDWCGVRKNVFSYLYQIKDMGAVHRCHIWENREKFSKN